MKNHITKPANAQSTGSKTESNYNSIDKCNLNKCENAAARFLNRFAVVKLLGECGAYKDYRINK